MIVCQALGQAAFRLDPWPNTGLCTNLLVTDHFKKACAAECWALAGMEKFNLMGSEVCPGLCLLEGGLQLPMTCCDCL